MITVKQTNVKRQKISNLLDVIQHNNFNRASSNIVSWSVYENDDLLVLISGGNKDERIKCNNPDIDKEFLWIKGSLKFIYADGTSYILDKNNPVYSVPCCENYLIKSMEDNTLCIVILKI